MLQILASCTNVKSFSLSEMPEGCAFDFMDHLERAHVLRFEHLDIMLDANLSKNALEHARTILKSILHLRNLKMLSIDVSAFLSHRFFEPFNFPHLEHLTFSAKSSVLGCELPSEWLMPQLKKVTLFQNFFWRPMNNRANLEQVFRQYGRGLVALECAYDGNELLIILDLCPHLVHLTLKHERDLLAHLTRPFRWRHPSPYYPTHRYSCFRYSRLSQKWIYFESYYDEDELSMPKRVET